MLKILVNGCNGKMGNVVCELISNSSTMEVIAGVDKNSSNSYNFPVFSNINEINVKPDAIIDFSLPVATLNILEYAKNNKIPMVIATTGFNENESKIIRDASKIIPIFQSANMSFDIMIMKKLVSWLAPLLENTDIEIIEAHHNRKVDSPSGTAQMLADSINNALDNKLYCEYNRHDKHEKRNKNEIGMSSIRGGNIVGEHTVQFIGDFETFEIKHTSYSRNVFAEGALKACEFLVTQKPGLYCMEDMCSLS